MGDRCCWPIRKAAASSTRARRGNSLGRRSALSNRRSDRRVLAGSGGLRARILGGEAPCRMIVPREAPVAEAASGRSPALPTSPHGRGRDRPDSRPVRSSSQRPTPSRGSAVGTKSEVGADAQSNRHGDRTARRSRPMRCSREKSKRRRGAQKALRFYREASTSNRRARDRERAETAIEQKIRNADPFRRTRRSEPKFRTRAARPGSRRVSNCRPGTGPRRPPTGRARPPCWCGGCFRKSARAGELRSIAAMQSPGGMPSPSPRLSPWIPRGGSKTHRGNRRVSSRALRGAVLLRLLASRARRPPSAWAGPGARGRSSDDAIAAGRPAVVPDAGFAVTRARNSREPRPVRALAKPIGARVDRGCPGSVVLRGGDVRNFITLLR